MRNQARFQENISICSAIQTIKGFIRMTNNFSKKHMRNDIIDFSYLNHALSERDLSYLGYL